MYISVYIDFLPSLYWYTINKSYWYVVKSARLHRPTYRRSYDAIDTELQSANKESTLSLRSSVLYIHSVTKCLSRLHCYASHNLY